MRTKRVAAQHAEFLDPTAAVGSSIRYQGRVEGHKSKKGGRENRSFDFNMYLTECNKSIQWSGYSTEGIKHMRTKLRSAVRIFEKALKDIKRLEKEYNALPVTKSTEPCAVTYRLQSASREGK